jgi:class 3 adenylate cyclase/DNA-binding response OmpR family regulator
MSTTRDGDSMAFAGDGDAMVFADDGAEPAGATEQASASVWKLLVIDDEPEVHDVTRLALGGLRVDGHPLAVLSAHTAAAGRAVLQAHTDVAVVVLDVVMESDDAGLELVRWIRGALENSRVRIVLRTGQPGHAPEQRVMFDYDINDYIGKTEVTAQRLITTVIGALRSYRDLCTIEAHKAGLEQVLRATAALFERQSIERFIAAVLHQLSALVSPQESAMFFRGGDLGFALAGESPTVVAGTGRFAAHVGRPVSQVVDEEVWQDVLTMLRTRRPVLRSAYNLFGIFRDESVWAAVFMEGLGELGAWDRRLVELFCANASVALDNHRLLARDTALTQAFARFVPERLLQLLGRDAAAAQLGDQIQREMTVMFVDLREFTSRAEQEGPAATYEFLNRFFAEIVPEIQARGGVVDKYLGDGLMALFPESPAQAVAAGLGVVERTARLGSGVGVGVHRGPVILGLVGAVGRLESTVVSDAVNIAARIERLTRRFHSDLLVSAAVAEQLPPELLADMRPLGSYMVPGKRQAVELLEVFAGDPPRLRAHKRATRAAVAEAVEAMTREAFDAAAEGFVRLLEDCPEDQVLAALVDECGRRRGRR